MLSLPSSLMALLSHGAMQHQWRQQRSEGPGEDLSRCELDLKAKSGGSWQIEHRQKLFEHRGQLFEHRGKLSW